MRKCLFHVRMFLLTVWLCVTMTKIRRDIFYPFTSSVPLLVSARVILLFLWGFFLHGVITAFDLWPTSALGRSCSSSNGVDSGEQCEPPTAQKKNRGTKSCPEGLFRTLQNIFNPVQWGARVRLIIQSTTVQKRERRRKPRKGAGMCSFGIFSVWGRLYSWIFYVTQFLQFYGSLLNYLIQLGTKTFVKGNKVKTQFGSCLDRRS